MIGLKLAPQTRPFEILALGAHPDDIEIGCGGTLLNLIAGFPNAVIRWVVLSGDAERRSEASKSADEFLSTSACHKVDLHRFRDGYFPHEAAAIKDCFEELKRDCRPSLIFTHWAGDAHQDHRAVSELTFNTFRDHMILEYEIPKIEGDLGNPQLFSALSSDQMKRKTSHIVRSFPSQADKRWFRPDTFTSLARLRGLACDASSGFAEAFYVRKLFVEFDQAEMLA